MTAEARLTVDTAALRHNVAVLRKAVGPAAVMAVVKANAYGHGAVEIARESVSAGADMLGVAFLDEAVQLRRGGIEAPILVLGYVPPEGFSVARELDISVAMFREDALEAAARPGAASCAGGISRGVSSSAPMTTTKLTASGSSSSRNPATAMA